MNTLTAISPAVNAAPLDLASTATKQINNQIDAIGQASKQLKTMIQECAVSIVFHAFRFGDVTLADRLLIAAGKNTRVDALAAWFEQNGPFVWNEKKGKFNYKAPAEVRELNDEFKAELMALPWVNGKKPPAIKSIYNEINAFNSLVAIIEGKIGKGEETANPWVLEELKRAAVRIRVKQAEMELQELGYVVAKMPPTDVEGNAPSADAPANQAAAG